jgi:microcystin degradation protein MlrC
MTRRLAVARFWFEGNAFSPLATTLDSFRRREWRAGEAALAAARGTESELAAVADFAAARRDWRVAVLRCASANPGGPIEEQAFAGLLDEIVSALRREHCDAVYLSLHGAAITDARATPDLDLVRAVRGAIGDVPLAASFDLHANLTGEMTALLDFASGYRTYPHTDMRDTAARVLSRLPAIADGAIRPAGAIVRVDALLPSFNMRSAEPPMRELLRAARAAERAPVLDVSLFGGFPYADTPHALPSAMAWADRDAGAARRAAQSAAAAMHASRGLFQVSLPDPAQAIRQALAAPPGLVAVTDPADNPLSGGAADTPGLLCALLEARVAAPAVFAFFADAGTVAQAFGAGPGAALDVTLGGKRSVAWGAPVLLRARVARLGGGRFRNLGPMECGLEVDVGRSCVLAVGATQIIVTERCVPANDPAFFALHEIDLARSRLLCVKAKNHFRAAFAQRCVQIVDCDAPGPASARLERLPFRNLRL